MSFSVPWEDIERTHLLEALYDDPKSNPPEILATPVGKELPQRSFSCRVALAVYFVGTRAFL